MRRTDTMATARDILIQNVSLGRHLVYLIDIYVFSCFSGRGGAGVVDLFGNCLLLLLRFIYYHCAEME